MDSNSPNDLPQNPSSPLEKYQKIISLIVSGFFGAVILVFLMVVVFVEVEPSKFPIIRFFMALSAAFFATFFVGGVLLRGTFKNFLLSATGGFVLFVLIQIFYDPWKVLPNESTSPRPGPIFSPTPMAKTDPNAIHKFYFIDPKLGERHDWSKVDETWVERYPRGAKMYRIVARITVDGDTGTHVQLSNDPSHEYFIPDKGSRAMSIRTRRTGGQWSFLGEMKDVE